jgi:hypothetical protein
MYIYLLFAMIFKTIKMWKILFELLSFLKTREKNLNKEFIEENFFNFSPGNLFKLKYFLIIFFI